MHSFCADDGNAAQGSRATLRRVGLICIVIVDRVVIVKVLVEFHRAAVELADALPTRLPCAMHEQGENGGQRDEAHSAHDGVDHGHTGIRHRDRGETCVGRVATERAEALASTPSLHGQEPRTQVAEDLCHLLRILLGAAVEHRVNTAMNAPTR